MADEIPFFDNAGGYESPLGGTYRRNSLQMTRDEWYAQPSDWRLRHPQWTPWSHPYNFDDYILWEKGQGKGDGSAYSDRMQQWDWEKYQSCWKQAFDERQDFADPEKTTKFLRLYYDDPELELIRVIATVNHASGYPLWCFIWKEGAAKKKARKEKEKAKEK